jgi:hypothetical protein
VFRQTDYCHGRRSKWYHRADELEYQQKCNHISFLPDAHRSLAARSCFCYTPAIVDGAVNGGLYNDEEWRLGVDADIAQDAMDLESHRGGHPRSTGASLITNVYQAEPVTPKFQEQLLVRG